MVGSGINQTSGQTGGTAAQSYLYWNSNKFSISSTLFSFQRLYLPVPCKMAVTVFFWYNYITVTIIGSALPLCGYSNLRKTINNGTVMICIYSKSIIQLCANFRRISCCSCSNSGFQSRLSGVLNEHRFHFCHQWM